jgi:hypothetical protein
MVQILPPAPRKPSFGSQLGLSLGQGISQGAIQQYQNRLAKEAEEAQFQRELQKMRLQGEQQKELQRERYGLEEGLLGKKQSFERESEANRPPPEKKPTKFQETFQKKMADEYLGIDDEIAKINASLQDLDYIEKTLAPEARSISGIIGTYTGLGSAGKELDTVAHAQLEPVIKVFNKSGPLAQSKLKLLQDVYIPQSTDTEATIQGKINGLRRLNQRTLEALEAKKKLIESYGGIENIEPEMMNQIDEITGKELSKLVDQDRLEGGQVSGLISTKDGRRLKPLSRKQAQQLIDQGLVTYGS